MDATNPLTRQSAPTPDAAQTADAALVAKRVRVYKAFLVATLLNNLGLAVLCFAGNGGPALATAPTWLAPILGALGVLTVVFAALGLASRKLGAGGVVVAGTAAIVASLVGGVPVFAAIFFLGTGLWALIARRNWYRLV